MRAKPRLLSLAVYLAALISVIGIVLTSLWPFSFAVPTSKELFEALLSPTVDPEITLFERLPFFVLAALFSGYICALRTRFFWLAFGFISLAAMVEVAQLFFDGRHARVWDLLIASSLGIAGIVFGRFIGRQESIRFSQSIRSVCILALIVIGGFWIWSGQVAKPLKAWDCTYQLGFGDEAGLNRTWTGELFEVRISDPEQVFTVFPTGNMVAPIVFPAASRLLASPPPNDLCRRISTSNAFSIQIKLRPSGESLTGPARILTWSESIYDQNVMIGEQNGNIHFRVNSGATGRRFTTEIFGPLPPDNGSVSRIEAHYKNGELSLFWNDSVIATGSASDVRLNNNLLLPRGPVMFFLFLLVALIGMSLYNDRKSTPSLNA